MDTYLDMDSNMDTGYDIYEKMRTQTRQRHINSYKYKYIFLY